MWQEQHRSVKRARDQAAAKAYLASREDSDYEFKRDHSRLLIVELCLKKQPYEWMSLSDIHAKTGLDPTEFLEQLKGDPNVELKDISEIGKDIFDVLNQPSSAPPTEKDIADLLYRAGKVNVRLLGPPDYLKFKERIGPSEEARREFWAKVKAMTWGHKVDGSTYAVLVRYGASRSLKDYWSSDSGAGPISAHAAAATDDAWRTEGHKLLRTRVFLRQVDTPSGTIFDVFGTIVGWVPDWVGSGPLFHVLHDDLDEEDLEEHEVIEAIAAYKRVVARPAKEFELRMRYVASSEYPSHVDVEYPVDVEFRVAVEETPTSAMHPPDIEMLDRRFTKVPRIFSLVRENDVGTLRRELSAGLTSDEIQLLNQPYSWSDIFGLGSSFGLDSIFLVHLVRSTEMLELLLEQVRLDLDAQRPDDGSTLLHMCVTNGYPAPFDEDVFEYLLQADCSTLVRNNRGLTALDEACAMLSKKKHEFKRAEKSLPRDQTFLEMDTELKRLYEIVTTLDGVRYAPSGTGAAAAVADAETRGAGGDNSAAAAAAAAAAADVVQRDKERRASRAAAAWSSATSSSDMQMYACPDCGSKTSSDELLQDIDAVAESVRLGFFRCPRCRHGELKEY